ncbi:MAG: MFS transporter, partial [Proteobacteria bacterium]|nr:MFS transporter [Pseudomonadota bacterium]
MLLNPQLQLVCAMTMMSIIGLSAISPALPAVVEAFDLKTETVGLLMVVFTLPGIFFIPITGYLADRFGRKVIVIPALFLYGTAGGLSGLAPDFETLLVLRFIAGIGGGSLGSLTLVLVADMFDDKQRSEALGYRLAMGNVANMIAPLITGAVVLLGWQYSFLIYFLAIPVGLVALKMMRSEQRGSSFSFRGYLGQIGRGLTQVSTMSLLAVGFTLTLTNHGITGVFIPLFMDQVLGSSPVLIGIVLSARTAVAAVASYNMGRLTRVVREETILLVGLALLAVSFVVIPFVETGWVMLFPVCVSGLVGGVGFPAFQSLLLRGGAKEAMAMLMST